MTEHEIAQHPLALGTLAAYVQSDPRFKQTFIAFLRCLAPMSAKGFSKKRIGRDFDGGYVMLDDFAGVEATYSFGIAQETSWDCGIADLGIDVFQYDHTIEALPEENPRFHWLRCGIGARPDPALPLTTIADALASNGHSGARDLILKCDIEGAEWEVFAAADPACLVRFRQIVVELHWLQRIVEPERCKLMMEAVGALTAHHQVVHVHGNNFAPIAIIGGIPVPSVLELTVVRKAGKTFVETNESFPTPLDMPNYQWLSDYHLGTFRFESNNFHERLYIDHSINNDLPEDGGGFALNDGLNRTDMCNDDYLDQDQLAMKQNLINSPPMRGVGAPGGHQDDPAKVDTTGAAGSRLEQLVVTIERDSSHQRATLKSLQTTVERLDAIADRLASTSPPITQANDPQGDWRSLAGAPAGGTFLLEHLLFRGVSRENWQMMAGEQIALTGLLARLRPKGAIEVGVYHGGSLSLTSQFAEHIIAIDIDPDVPNRFRVPSNVEVRIGDSVELIPKALESFRQAGRPINFVLIDADHSAAGVKRDIELILAYTPTEPMIILMHDSGNPETRRGIQSVSWADNPHVHKVELDFVPGQIQDSLVVDGRGEIWGGLALAYLDHTTRVGPPEIKESAAISIRCLHVASTDLVRWGVVVAPEN